MAYVAVIINVPNETNSQINAKLGNPAADVSVELNALIDYLSAIAGGNKPASFYVVSRDTDPVVTTSGTDSASNSYSHL